LAPEEYLFCVERSKEEGFSEEERAVLENAIDGRLVIDDLKSNPTLKIMKVPLKKTIESLKEKEAIECIEIRYDFKNTKISTGLFGINRVFLPSSDIFPTLVASDTNDYVALKDILPTSIEDYRRKFLEEIYMAGKYRKITKREACLIQGFPSDFILPEARTRWMKLIGNSVSVPVIEMLCKAILNTGVFDGQELTCENSKSNLVAELF